MGWGRDLVSIFFPKRCVVCTKLLLEGESSICVECRSKMPLTHYWNVEDNYLTDLFAGRVLLYSASALFYYRHDSHWRDAIHDMKYKSVYDVADVFGQIYGYHISGSKLYEGIDLIVPIPLHGQRFAKRGFNQAEVFARAIAKVYRCQVESRAVVRTINTPNQALKKSAHERWENVAGAFAVVRPELLVGKTIMIVDDVITTGATIESCTRAIEQAIPEMRFFVGAMAVVKKGTR